MKRPQIRGQLLPIVLHRDPVYADGGTLPQPVICADERWLVDETRQRQDSLARIPFRSFRYLRKFR
jgi:hypothetical protein